MSTDNTTGFDDWHGGRYRGLQLDIARAAWVAAVAAERERCAQYLRDAADRLAPDGKRVNQVDRHVALVLAAKGDELAAGAHDR